MTIWPLEKYIETLSKHSAPTDEAKVELAEIAKAKATGATSVRLECTLVDGEIEVTRFFE